MSEALALERFNSKQKAIEAMKSKDHRWPINIERRSVTKTILGFIYAAGLSIKTAMAKAELAPTQTEDEGFMRLALEEARQGDFPFGALIVQDKKVVASGHNTGIKSNDPTAHGEIVAIRNFTSKYPANNLKGATIYTTGEPCPMCMGAIIWCGFGRVVYAASIKQLSTRLDQIQLTCSDLAEASPMSNIKITGGILASDALDLFK
jgi:guanine deaminase